MPYVNIWIHAVWSTKYRKNYLSQDIRKDVFSHIKLNALEKGINLDFINGYSDHTHALISLGKIQTIADIMQSIKGESSAWVNKNKLTTSHLIWQDDYYAASVCPTHIQNVRNYIRAQEIHHSNITWEEEIEILIKNSDSKNLRILKNDEYGLRIVVNAHNPSAKADGKWINVS